MKEISDKNIKIKFLELLENNKHCMAQYWADVGTLPGIYMRIQLTDDHKVHAVRPYAANYKHRDEIDRQTTALEKANFIRKSNSNWASGVTMVAKKQKGEWRMCVDYRMLNRQTKKDKYPIPRIDELLDKLGRAQYFTKLDLASSYHQIAMKAEDVHKTAFRTTQGSYEF